MRSPSSPLLPKTAFTISLPAVEKRTNVRSRLRLRLPGDETEKNPHPYLCILISALVSREMVAVWVQ